LKLIVVDDYPLEGRTVEYLLQKNRPDITYCGQALSGEAGLQLAARFQPDVAIVDVAMPGMNGLELTRLLRKQLPQTKVIILSAYNDFSFAQSALRYGASDYMLKPIGEEELFRTIDTVCAVPAEAAIPPRQTVSAETSHPKEAAQIPLEPAYELIERAKQFIADHLGQELTLELVAREIFISPYYLSRIFKKCIGTNFIHYVMGLRIDRAKHLLFTTNDTIDSIAQQVGYQECNSFRRLFKQQVGMTPREYRITSRE